MNPKTGLTLAFCIIAAAISTGSGTSQINNSECVQAQTWHLQQALHWRTSGQPGHQDWHLGAAAAAEKLATMSGSPCGGWKTDAQPLTIDSQGRSNTDAP